MKGSTKDIIQWHPAFHASNQIEFKNEAEKLTFDSEHLLSKKPMQMGKMIQHLKDFRKLDTVRIEPGIYYITGDPFPIQLLVTKELNPNENRWLQSLRNDVSKPEEITTLLKEYEKNKSSKLYQAAMNVIIRANWNAVKEVKESMCEALRELMADEFKEQEERVTEQVTEQITTQIIKNLYDTIKDVEKIASLLKMPVEQVERAIKK